MAKNCIGLDLGSSAIKVTQLKQTRRGCQLVNFGIEPLPPDTIVDGAILNPSSLVEAIQALFGRLKIRHKEVAIAISGNALISKKISVPAMAPEELDEQILWEAEHHIPFNKKDVEIDYQVLSEKSAQGQVELLLVAAKKEVVADYAAVVREASLNPVVVDVSTFALQNGFEVAHGRPTAAVVLINIGASLSNMNILADGTTAFTRDVSMSGNVFTDEIKRQLNVSTEEAESLKVAFGNGDATDEVGRILGKVAHGMAGEFQKSIDFFLASNPDLSISRIYLAGGSARVPPLLPAVEARARVPVEVMEPFRNLPHAAHLDPLFLRAHGAQGVVSLGLALRSPGDKLA